jgi:hypothetical protein
VLYEMRVGMAGVSVQRGSPRFGLFRCEVRCVKVANLDGGYGTVGKSVVAAIPLRELGLEDAGTIHNLLTSAPTAPISPPPFLMLGPQPRDRPASERSSSGALPYRGKAR